jgi:hypothetical protein
MNVATTSVLLPSCTFLSADRGHHDTVSASLLDRFVATTGVMYAHAVASCTFLNLLKGYQQHAGNSTGPQGSGRGPVPCFPQQGFLEQTPQTNNLCKYSLHPSNAVLVQDLQ